MDESARKRLVKQRYDQTVNEYERLRFGTPAGRFLDTIEKTYVLKHLNKGSILHVGTATGRMSRFLPRFGYEYLGIEISGSMARASQKVSRGVNSQIVQGDGETMPFRDNLFDNVLCVRSFHFLPNPRTFLSEAYRVLRKPGQLIVSFETFVPIRKTVEKLGILPRPLPPRATYRVSEISKMFEEARFDVTWAGKVTKLPLVAYFRSTGLRANLIERLHPYVPFWFGTVGLVVGNPKAR